MVIPRPMWKHTAFHACWARLMEPLELSTALFTNTPAAIGVSWPLQSWLYYVHSRPEFTRLGLRWRLGVLRGTLGFEPKREGWR